MPDVFFLPFTEDVADLPVSKIFEVDNTEYTYEIDYNETYDFYTLKITDANGDLVYSTKLLYGSNALHAINEAAGISSKIVPYDLTGLNTRIETSNFGDPVKLYVVEAE